MGDTIAQKIIKAHLVEGEMIPGQEIGLRIDQTLTQDATGTMAYLEFEAMGVPRVKTERSVAYIDHNTLQTGFENADDHRFIQSIWATASATRFIWSGSVSRARPSLAPTPTPPPAAASVCWPWGPAVWMWRWPWAAAPTISPCPGW